MPSAGTLEGLFWAFLPFWGIGALLFTSMFHTVISNLSCRIKQWLKDRRDEH